MAGFIYLKLDFFLCWYEINQPLFINWTELKYCPLRRSVAYFASLNYRNTEKNRNKVFLWLLHKITFPWPCLTHSKKMPKQEFLFSKCALAVARHLLNWVWLGSEGTGVGLISAMSCCLIEATAWTTETHSYCPSRRWNQTSTISKD